MNTSKIETNITESDRIEKRQLTCIGCPMGCTVQVKLQQGKVVEVTGNTCKRGEEYARKEVTNPTRIVTSTVCVQGGTIPQVSVKTGQDIPKQKVMECVKELSNVVVMAPVKIGDVVKKNVAGTGVDMIATRKVSTLEK